jgi:hypothetical protein
MNSTDTRNLPALLRLLADGAESEHLQLAQLASEALAICQSEFAVHAATNLQLQAALASIRDRRPEDAVECIKIALDIESRWIGADPPEDSAQSTVADRSPRVGALLLIAATLLIVPVGVVTLATRPIAYVHNRASALLEALWREILRPS